MKYRDAHWWGGALVLLLATGTLANAQQQAPPPATLATPSKRAESDPPPKSNEAAGARSELQTNRGKRGPVIDGESFTVRQMIDREQGGIPVCVFIAPEKWKDTSKVVWNYANHSSPVKLEAVVENPANEETLFAFPTAEFFCLRPDAGYYRPGQNVGGLMYTVQPLPPAQALIALIQQTRGTASNFKVIGTKDLPDLPSALQLPASPNQRGVGVKVCYDFRGTPVDEEFYGVYYTVQIPYDGPQGRTWQINWGLAALHSFRARSGTLDARRPVFAAMARSFRPNPAWQTRLAAVNTYLQEQFNRQLQAGYDQIAAAAQLSRQISANNDAMLSAIDSRLQASRASGAAGGGTGGRSANDKFSEYIRGVETVDDPYYGTSQHSSNQQYHWTDGYGSYRHSNDPTANPNQTETGDWQLMQPTR